MVLGVQSLAHYPDQGGGFSAANAALLRNAAYLRLLRQLIETATMKIRVTMFFFSASDQSPGRELALALEAACKRGVEVQVILGHDLPGDPHGARRVNQNIRRVLHELNIPYRLHWPEVALHEKSVVIDGRHVLVGSHNWTIPSFYQYDETSVYVDSTDLATALEERFEARWLMLHERTAARQIPLTGLSLLDGDQRRRLEAENIHLANKLPAADDALEALAKG
jgi:phosphatidylserine/phosphatidylglycerophosphate/cardiolipin synthase-like enzyme